MHVCFVMHVECQVVLVNVCAFFFFCIECEVWCVCGLFFYCLMCRLMAALYNLTCAARFVCATLASLPGITATPLPSLTIPTIFGICRVDLSKTCSPLDCQ